ETAAGSRATGALRARARPARRLHPPRARWPLDARDRLGALRAAQHALFAAAPRARAVRGRRAQASPEGREPMTDEQMRALPPDVQSLLDGERAEPAVSPELAD